MRASELSCCRMGRAKRPIIVQPDRESSLTLYHPTIAVTQCDRARQNATTCSSAVFIGEAGNSASASTAIAP